ncbi:MAG TPA: hypothetical protein PK536_04755 [Ignavibacteria bacterium]|nr:hypothetical protein [Bacteroidota bacterium]HRI84740.1 hypothetical protein [Ignavibacteria bacterium]HRJ99481.1 hypothetical protein [Ignavibacteria bacterium]HRK00069.1 hypothetical protein [Ignavibacteria bacterium]
MDLEKVKSSYKWDPNSGDYSKSYVSYERRISNKQKFRKFILTVLYILILLASVVIIFAKFS